MDTTKNKLTHLGDVSRSPSVNSRKYDFLFDVLVIFVFPTIFFFYAPIQRFPPAGWVDAGLYLGLSMDYAYIVKAFGWDYHSLRVSYLLPNVVSNFVLPPVPARLLVAWGFYFAGITALYGGARKLWGRIPAATAVSCLAYNPLYLLAATAGYVDAAYLAYTFALFFALTMWSNAQNPCWLALSGAFAVCGVLAHLLALAPIGLIFLFFIIVNKDGFTAKFRVNVISLLTGVIIAWLFFVVALIKMRFGIKAFSQLGWIVNASLAGFGAKYRFAVMDWLPFTTRLLPHMIVCTAFLGAVITDIQTLKKKDVAAAIVLFLSFAMLPIYDASVGGSTTQSAFYAGLTVPGLMIGTASLMALTLPKNATIRFIIYLSITLIAVLFNFNSELFSYFAQSIAFIKIPISIIIISVSASTIYVLHLSKHAVGRSIFCLMLLTLCFFSLATNTDTRQIYKQNYSINNKEYFEGAVFVRNLINPVVLNGRKPFFWFDRNEFHTHDGRSAELARKMRFGDSEMVLSYYDTLASLRLWDKSLFSAQLSASQDVSKQLHLLDSAVTLVVLYQDSAKLDFALTSIRKAGLNCQVTQTSRYSSESFDVTITLIELNGQSGQPTCSREE